MDEDHGHDEAVEPELPDSVAPKRQPKVPLQLPGRLLF